MRSPVDAVLERYHLPSLANLVALGNRGGFSGAQLWRGEFLGGTICVRAWPEGTTATRLSLIHRLMDQARQAGLAFVPNVYRMSDDQCQLQYEGRSWDVTAWMPGTADFDANPSAERLANVCTALAQLHRAWTTSNTTGPCPAVIRRLERIREWQTLVDSGWRPDFSRQSDQPWHAWAECAWRIALERIPRLLRKLTPWVDVTLPLQPCLCDIWHDHVLYSGNTVTGLIDYGSVKTDHVAVDLARLLGSLVEEDEGMRSVGLEAYARGTCFPESAIPLVDLLDETGVVLGTANWVVWLYHDGRKFPDVEAVSQRLASLVRRLEQCSPLGFHRRQFK